MFDDGLLSEAHAFMTVRALKSVPAIDAVADPVARLWCRSFGAQDDEAVARLKGLLADTAIDVISRGGSLDELQDRLDAESESIIRAWFARVLGRPVDGAHQALAIVRLAFLDINHDGRWSRWFLADDAPLAELASELDGCMIEPTPAVRPRQMVRQEL
jgi:hypothetical protein